MKLVMTPIISVAVQISDFFSRGVFLAEHVLVFSWMSNRDLSRAGLLVVFSVVS